MRTKDEILESIKIWRGNKKVITDVKTTEGFRNITFRTDYTSYAMMSSIAGMNEWLVEPRDNHMVEITIWY